MSKPNAAGGAISRRLSLKHASPDKTAHEKPTLEWPTLEWEEHLGFPNSPVAGVDEVGRGCLAGPVVAAAVVLPAEINFKVHPWLEMITDSKKLSPEKRDTLAPQIQAWAKVWAIGVASVEEIDRINIFHASHLAMQRAVESLGARPSHVLVDGKFKPVFSHGGALCASTAIVKGDLKCLSIAAASIIAKVWRDTKMVELDTQYPGYAFGVHKGYATPAHQEALKRLGACEIHRKSFAPVAEVLQKSGRVALERALSKLGIASRTQAREWILAGRVRVAGVVMRDPLRRVVPETANIEVDGLKRDASMRRVIAFHKPKGVVTTRSDEKGRKTVFALLEGIEQYLVAVGRLDFATTGLLILTNDTQLAAWLTDPVNEIPRVYIVTVRGKVSEEKAQQLEAGVIDKREALGAASIEILKASGRETHLRVTLTEGKNREIRRMMAAVGHEVTRLKRVAFGGLELGDLVAGKWREISDEELEAAFPARGF